MPKGGPGVPQVLTPPQTRATQMWFRMWSEFLTHSPARLARAQRLGRQARILSARR